jgi:hypothetical protein
MAFIRNSVFAIALFLSGTAFAQEPPLPKQTGGSVPPIMVPASPDALKNYTLLQTKAPKSGVIRASYVGPCGGSYICYDDSVIICGRGGRPYESISDRECYCWRDSCP